MSDILDVLQEEAKRFESTIGRLIAKGATLEELRVLVDFASVGNFMKEIRETVEGVTLSVKKLHPDACLPVKEHDDDACFDVCVCEDAVLYSQGFAILRTGLAFEVPEGYFLEVRPMSDFGFKGILMHIGTLDAGYRGELKVCLYNCTVQRFSFRVQNNEGVPDRIAQIRLERLLPTHIEEVEELSETERGEDGFGNTG